MALISKDMKIDDIIAYCKEHGEVAWLKEVCARKTERKVYPRIKVVNPDGTVKSVADKTKKPKIVTQPISFVEVKREFMDKFAPEERVGKHKKPTFHDMIADL